MTFDIVNPLDIPNWDDLVLATGTASFFHSSAWARVLHESYGYKPVYFASFDGSRLVSVIPFMEIDSWLTGRRAVSLPFSDYCDAIVPDEEFSRESLGHVTELGRRARWKYVEWRSPDCVGKGTVSCATFFGHRLSLAEGSENLLMKFKSNTRRNIKTSIRKGVHVGIFNSLAGMKTFYRLHVQTRKRHGLPPQPFSFFEKIDRHVIQKNLGFIMLAAHMNRAIAGMIFVHFGNHAVFKYGASDTRWLDLRPNNAVLWEAIKFYQREGVKDLCFGRTAPWQQGLLRFKRGWGATERSMEYYRYDLQRQEFSKGWIQVNGFHNRVFRRCPTSLLKIAASFLYKHIG
jgi:hypothetical protein